VNGWSRVPDTLTARCQVEDYLRRPIRPPWIRVLRVARQIELYLDGQTVFSEKFTRWALGPASSDWDDVWNDAVRLVARRHREREEARKRTPSWERVTHELTPSGDLRPVA
jgi:hypothetical protein